jgi:spore coat polysaccharide biosynthesis predicted glycosyltransferase SpsG
MEIYPKKLIKNAFFRFNLNNKIGLGHFFRILKIVNKIKKKYKIYLILDTKIKNIKILNLISSFNIIYLYNNNKYKNQFNDASIFLKKTSSLKKDVIFVDDYRFNSIWHKKVYNFTNKLIVIDDLIKKIYCDFYINYKHQTDSRQKKLIQKNSNKGCKLLLGTKYVFLDDKLQRKKKKFKKRKVNIIINFGNSFDFQKIKIFINNFLKIKDIRNYKLFICIGILAKNYQYLLKISEINQNVSIIFHKLSLSKYINKTDFFIGSSGNSIYENSFLNIPSLFIYLNKNQMNQRNDLIELGHFFSFNIQDISKPSFLILIKIILNKLERISKLNKTKSIDIKKNNIKDILNQLKL